MKHKRSIHQVLIFRLLIATLCISAALSAIVVFIQFRIIDERVMDRAASGVERFRLIIMENLDTPGLGDHERIRQTLQKSLADGIKSPDGQFVLVYIYDLDFREVATVSDQTYQYIAAVTDYAEQGIDRSVLAREGVWKKMRRLQKDVMIILLAGELKNSANMTVGYAVGAFAVSPVLLSKARWDVFFTTLIAAGIVLITALLLYPVIVHLLRRSTALSARLLHANLEILNVLGSAVAKRDSDTDIHNYRVTLYAVRLAQELGLPDEDIRALLKGAFLHDVGKIGISDNILLKPGKLTPEEFEEMKKHVSYGVDIISRSSWLVDAVRVVGGHHEKYDGSGYLERLNNETIPRVARIFAIADVFDALTSKRPYKEPLGFEESIKIMGENRGGHFDPELLDVFLRIAWQLYDTYANRNDDRPRQDLQRISAQYFSPELVEYAQ
jgi:HD-GYP domain-containing protein (c-di-GMP phosphodiesterase class II)